MEVQVQDQKVRLTDLLRGVISGSDTHSSTCGTPNLITSLSLPPSSSSLLLYHSPPPTSLSDGRIRYTISVQTTNDIYDSPNFTVKWLNCTFTISLHVWGSKQISGKTLKLIWGEVGVKMLKRSVLYVKHEMQL